MDKYRVELDDIIKKYYTKSFINKYIYYGVVTTVLISLPFNAYNIGLIKNNIIYCFIGYILAQIAFTTGHMNVHSRFTYSKLTQLGTYVAYIHHYEQPTSLSYFWLEHRLSYLYDTPLAFLPWFFFINTCVIKNCFVYYIFWWLNQAPIHEWYHLNKNQRCEYFSPIVNNWCYMLEFLNILDTKKHKLHHLHHKKSLDEVKHFDDMIFPIFTNIEDMFWDLGIWCRNKYSMNEDFMFIYTFSLHTICTFSSVYFVNYILS